MVGDQRRDRSQHRRVLGVGHARIRARHTHTRVLDTPSRVSDTHESELDTQTREYKTHVRRHGNIHASVGHSVGHARIRARHTNTPVLDTPFLCGNTHASVRHTSPPWKHPRECWTHTHQRWTRWFAIARSTVGSCVRVYALGFRPQDLVSGFGLKTVSDFGFLFSGFGFRVCIRDSSLGSWIRGQGSGVRV